MRDVLIIGGGPAGASLAIRLAEAGRDVLLLERTAGPHDKVCGEFLSHEAQEELASLGLDLDALGAERLDKVMAVRRSRQVAAGLGFMGRSLSRRILDESLLQRAAASGAEVRRGVRVAGVERDGLLWRAAVQGTDVRARTAVLATGKHDLRGRARPPGPQSDLIGLKTYWRLNNPLRLAGRVELHLFSGGYAGLQLVEGGRANLCLVLRACDFALLGRRWETILKHLRAASPTLSGSLAGAEPCQDRPFAIAGIPYGLVQDRSEGLWRIGDQAAVIPSFTGEGISIALLSARMAAEALLTGLGPEAFQRRLARRVAVQVRRSTIVSKALVTPLGQVLIGRLATPGILQAAIRATRMAPASRP